MISLIIPCWNDRPRAIALAQKWAGHPLIKEVIIASVNSNGALNHPTIKECSTQTPGRGSQMNLAAARATGETLLFHHVDSRLTEAHLQSVMKLLGNGSQRIGGAFYRKFDRRHPGLRFL